MLHVHIYANVQRTCTLSNFTFSLLHVHILGAYIHLTSNPFVKTKLPEQILSSVIMFVMFYIFRLYVKVALHFDIAHQLQNTCIYSISYQNDVVAIQILFAEIKDF